MSQQMPLGFHAAPPPVVELPSREASSVAPSPPRQTASRQGIKRPRPAFRCDPCQLDFNSSSALQAHTASHVQCEECGFEGVPKVVKGHQQAKHGKFSAQGFKTITVAVPGCPVQRFRICVGNRPEDVQAWIAERKKRFPRRNPVPVEDNLKESKNRKDSRTQSSPKETGLSSLLDGYGSSDDEDEKTTEEDKATEKTKDSLPNQHASSTFADGDSKEPTRTKNAAIEPTSRCTNRRPCHAYERYGSCPRGDRCPYEHFPKKGLLAKLLEQDQQREMLLTLQLFEYIYDTSYLEEPQK